jgi:hypothetical protein
VDIVCANALDWALSLIDVLIRRYYVRHGACAVQLTTIALTTWSSYSHDSSCIEELSDRIVKLDIYLATESFKVFNAAALYW